NAIVRAQPATHDLNERPRPAERAQPVSPQRPAEPSPARTESERSAPVATAPPPSAAASPRAAVSPASAKANEEGGGWLRDVLRNASASQPDQQSPPRNLSS